VGSAAQALALITDPMRTGDGYRHLWLGDTGQGKTVAMRHLVDVPGQLTMIHDVAKARPEYPRVKYFRNPAEALAAPAAEAGALSAIGFRGDPFAGISCTAHDVAELALIAARRHVPTRVIFDELNKALNEAGSRLESPELLSLFTEGRSMGLSVAIGTQTPQRVPGTVLDSLSSVGIFRLGPRSLNYLDERLMFDAEMLAAVPELKVFECVLHRPGFPWDRTIYKFPPQGP